MNLKEVEQQTEEALAKLAAAADLAAVEALRVQYIGRNGLLPKLMQGLKDVPAADKPAMGQALNRFKVAVTEAVAERKLRWKRRRSGRRRARLIGLCRAAGLRAGGFILFSN